MARMNQLLLFVALVLSSCANAEKLEPVYEGKPLHEWIALLKYGDTDTRRVAVWALEKMGPDAKPAVPQLIEALQDEDLRVRRNAIWALEKIGPEAEAAIPHLVAMLPDKECGSSAGCALGKFGEPGL